MVNGVIKSDEEVEQAEKVSVTVPDENNSEKSVEMGKNDNNSISKSTLLSIHNWLYHHIPISKNTDDIVKDLVKGIWTTKQYQKLSELIDNRAKILGIWTDCPSKIVLDEKSNPTLEQSINHIVNLYKYRDVQVLKLESSDNEIKSQNHTRNTIIHSGDYRLDFKKT